MNEISSDHAPKIGLAAPGAQSSSKIHDFTHGAFEVMVVSDGHLVLPTSLLAPDAPTQERSVTLASAALTLELYEPAANITLISGGDALILFDTGGTGYQPHLGKLSDNLLKAGVDPASVTKVVFTHGHPDHIWGTVMPDGSVRFPNASYYSGAAEWDFWNSENVWTALPSEQHPFARGARRQYAAICDRVVMVQPGQEIHPGVRAIATPGHTLGHLSFEVSGDEGLIIVADANTSPEVYFPHPDWTFGFDGDNELAIASRKRLLDRAATDGTKLLGYHWPFPGVGHAERNDFGYHFAAARRAGAPKSALTKKSSSSGDTNES